VTSATLPSKSYRFATGHFYTTRNARPIASRHFLDVAGSVTVCAVGFDPARDYPLGSRRPDLVRTPGGIPLDQLRLEDGQIDAAELRATAETLRMQAEVAHAAGRPQLAENLLRAAELSGVPADTVLEIYTALRPGRSTAAELEGWAGQLESWHAPQTAAFVREAAAVYAERGLLAL
jgi:propanediol dehydratase small subunit